MIWYIIVTFIGFSTLGILCDLITEIEKENSNERKVMVLTLIGGLLFVICLILVFKFRFLN